MSVLRVLCVDDNEEILQALVLYLDRVPDLEVVGSLPCATHLEETVRDTRPDIMVLDLDMPGQNPLEALRHLNDSGATTRTVIFSGHVRSQLIVDAMDAGAWGYVSKNDGEAELLAAIRSVRNGQIAWSPEIRSTIARR
jgi:DNA-binding NarL/FixJ family response regulator